MKKRKGLTLIEVIVSFAIMSLIAVTILSMFNISISNIFKSGTRTEEVLNLKESIDESIKNNEIKTNGNEEISISIPDISFEKKIEGNMIDAEFENLNIKIQTFVPIKVD